MQKKHRQSHHLHNHLHNNHSSRSHLRHPLLKSTKPSTLEFLKILGLSPEESTLYLTLNEHGALTSLELSRKTNIPRSSIYRYLKQLRNQGLAEKIVDQYRSKTQAAPPDKLELIIRERQSQLEYLQQRFPLVSQQLNKKRQSADQPTQVLFYRRPEGIKQMVWNVLRSKKDALGYTYRPIEEIIGKRLAESFYMEFAHRKLKFRDLYSQPYLTGLKTSQKDGKQTVEGSPDHFFGRYLPPKVLNIDIQIDIYNNVFALYNWHQGEVFGVEIYNQKFVDFQKQIFEILWEKAGKYKK